MPPIMPRGHVPLVRDVDQHPREGLQRAGCLGAGGGAFGLVGAIRHRLRGPVVRQALQCDGIPRAVPREPGGQGPTILGDPHRRMHSETPECGS